MMVRRYFILGTDTDCGKTYVTKAIAARLTKANQVVHAIKPVAAGMVSVDYELINDDVLAFKNTNLYPDLPVNLFSFLDPISPHLAAKKAGTSISMEAIAQFCAQFDRSSLDLLLVEGAGGLMAPLNDHQTWVDFLKKTGMEVILVVGLKLGCLNHALMTAAVLKLHQISCLGWVANCLDKSMRALTENQQTLVNRLDMPFLGEVAYQGDFVPSTLGYYRLLR